MLYRPLFRSGPRAEPRRVAPVLAALCSLVLCAGVAGAQGLPDLERPGDTRPELPPYRPPAAKPGTLLPPIPLPQQPDTDALAAGRRVRLREVVVVGSSVLTPEDLHGIAAPYLDRDASFADILALRDAVTRAYIERGYLTSGAVVPDQSLADGVLEIRVVEGVLADVEVETDGRYRPGFLAAVVQRSVGNPVQVERLEESLQLLQQDPRIAAVDAELLPGEVRGDARLRLRVTEESPYFFRTELSNHQSPSIGEERARVALGYDNLLGFGDAISAVYSVTRGLHQVDVGYDFPLNTRGTRFGVHALRSWSEVVLDPFEELDIESRSATYGATLSHPLYRSVAAAFDVSLTAEYRRSQSSLLSRGFSFEAGPQEGLSKLTVLRLRQDYTHRTREQVFALRSTFSVGINVLGATRNRGSVPDGRFLAWLGQVQWARRLPFLSAQLVARADVQLSRDALLALEQFAVGGHATVRGYRENQLVRDNGVVGSLELRVPVLRRFERWAVLELAAFADVGNSWSSDRKTLGPRTLASAGVGLRLALWDRVRLHAYWAHPFKEIQDLPDSNLQDDGLHLALSLELP